MVAITHSYTLIGKKFGAVVIAQTILPKVTYLLAEKSLDGEQYAAMLADIEEMLQTITTLRQPEFAKKAEEKAKKEEEEKKKQRPILQAAFCHIKGGSGKRGHHGEQHQRSRHANRAGGADPLFLTRHPQVFKNVLQKKEQQKGKRPIVERPSKQEKDSFPSSRPGVQQIFRQASHSHENIGHTDKQKKEIEPSLVPVVADEIAGGKKGYNDTKAAQNNVGILPSVHLIPPRFL